MIDRLRKPGGTLGTLSLASAITLAVVGVVGVVAMAIGLISGSDFWSDQDSDMWTAMVFFAVGAIGAYGFVIEDHYTYAGAALAVLGGLAIGAVLFWSVIAIVVGLGVAVVAVLRARALHEGETTAAKPA
jgi:hypothetical protein